MRAASATWGHAKQTAKFLVPAGGLLGRVKSVRSATTAAARRRSHPGRLGDRLESNRFDTLKYANRLKQAGFSPEQAEALAGALAEALDAHQVELSTKVDIVSVSSALSSDIAAFKSELSSEFASLRADLASMEARQIAALEKMGQTLFIRLGSLMTVLFGLLAVISRMPH